MQDFGVVLEVTISRWFNYDRIGSQLKRVSTVFGYRRRDGEAGPRSMAGVDGVNAG